MQRNVQKLTQALISSQSSTVKNLLSFTKQGLHILRLCMDEAEELMVLPKDPITAVKVFQLSIQ